MATTVVKLWVPVAALTAALLGFGSSPAYADPSEPPDGPVFDQAAAEQQREDQCLMSTVLKLAGPAMKQVAATGLDGDAAQLHTAADPDYWDTTPLSTAYTTDNDATSAYMDALGDRYYAWQAPLASLTASGDFHTDAEFHWAPRPDFFDSVGLGPWLGQRFWTSEGTFYEDPTPLAGAASAQAATTLGNAQFPEPDWHSPTADRDYDEHQAWQDMSFMHDLFADDTRLLLQRGGFARTAPDPGSVEYRVDVEDLKSRFASCEWRTPEDPNAVLGQEVATASTEWQAEIAGQQTQRDALLTANAKATGALTKAADALGEILGQSWIADHASRWQAWWQPGGPGTAGSGAMKVQLKGATTLCLDNTSSLATNGNKIEAYTCNNSAAQAWSPQLNTQLDGPLVNLGTSKCLDTSGANVVLYACTAGKATQHWQYTTTGGLTRLYNVGTRTCLDFTNPVVKQAATVKACTGGVPQQFVTLQDNSGTGTGTDSLSYPKPAEFTQARKALQDAQTVARTQLQIAQAQSAIAQQAAADTTTAENQAYAIADAAGTPRGRGLLAAQQEAQVTMASAAALQAVAGAAQTAYQATTASAADTDALQQLAQTQGAAAKAAFRLAAAQEADAQAKAAAAGAAQQAKAAAAANATAQAALAKAQKAEVTAQHAAQVAHAKRLAAEAEQQRAAADRQEAAADEAQAASDEAAAERESSNASAALARAQTAGATAADKRHAAEAADADATEARRRAWDAAHDKDAAAQKAAAADAYADAHASDANAQQSRAAANQADAAAADATAAADRAQADADSANAAARAADAAATRAEAAASRAQSDADAARAAKATADSALRTSEAAVATAVAASAEASSDAAAAKQDAASAKADAATARQDADQAGVEAASAQTSAASTAGYAYTTARAAAAASDAAQQVVAPANDAIQLGAPYVETDSSAGLAVLTAQASKTIAEQQQATAQAKADQAAQAAASAQALADAATGDAKLAQVAAADAAAQAAAAQISAQQAIASAAAAQKAVALTKASAARTAAYDAQATADASAAQAAATSAASDASAARASANQAESDASAAQAAADDAKAAAAEARDVAAQADRDAAAAEAAAKDAEQQAASAQQALTSVEQQTDSQTLTDLITTQNGIYTQYTITHEDVNPNGDCVGTETGPHAGCEISLTFHFTGTTTFYWLPPCTLVGTTCTTNAIFLGDAPLDVQFTKPVHVDGLTITEAVLKGVLTGAVADFVHCAHGSVSGCAWAAAMVFPPDWIGELADFARILFKAIDGAVSIETATMQVRMAQAMAGVGLEGIETSVVRTLAATEGATVSKGDLASELVEMFRRLSLGKDPAKGATAPFNVGEMQTALRVEGERGVSLTRDASGNLEWYDQSGRGYDAVGNSPAQYLDVDKFTRSIKSHLLKSDRNGSPVSFIPVDVSTYDAGQISQIKDFIGNLTASERARVFIVGDHG
jgi:Ricin-type beta-trefoil lectin domain